MAISLVGFTTTYSGNVNSVSAAMPTGTQANDVLLAFVNAFVRATGVVGTDSSSGWTSLGQQADPASDTEITCLWKLAGPGEAGPYTFTNSNAGCNLSVYILSYRGCDPSTAINTFSSQTTTTAAPVIAALTTTVDNCQWVAAGSDLGSGTVFGGTPLNTVVTGSGGSFGVADAPLATAGSTGISTWSDSGGLSPSIGYSVALAPVVIPTNKLEWPIPAGATPAVRLRTWTYGDPKYLGNVYGTGPYGAGAFGTGAPSGVPFASTDWPVPKGPMHANSLRIFSTPVQLPLRSRDRFFGGAGQPPTYDWPVPKGRVPASSLLTWAFALLPGVRPPAAPFFVTNWPVPSTRLPASELRTFHSRYRLFFVQSPFSFLNWVVPHGRHFSSFLRGWLGASRIIDYVAPPPASSHRIPRGLGNFPATQIVDAALETEHATLALALYIADTDGS